MSMSALELYPTHPVRGSALDLLDRMRAAEPRFFDLGVLHGIAMIPTAFAAWLDPRLIDGASVWLKPLKFEFSLTVYLLTLALFALMLPVRVRQARWYRVYSMAVVLAVLGEMAWLIGAAMLGTHSHFNATPVGQIIFPIMGVLATLLTTATTVYAWQIWRNPTPAIAPTLRSGVIVGLALVLPLTLLTAGTMSGMGSSYIGDAAEPVRLAIMGWARDGGDLRVSHFFATHAMHVIPAFALGAVALGYKRANLAVLAIVAAYVALVGWTYVEALLGRPFLPVL